MGRFVINCRHQIASASADHSIRIWDIRKLGQISLIAAHKDAVSDVRFFRQNELHTSKKYSKENEDVSMYSDDTATWDISGLFLASSSFDGTVKIWSADDWKLVQELTGHEGKVMSVDISCGN